MALPASSPVGEPAGQAANPAAQRLTDIAGIAYDTYSHDCSHSIWFVLKQIVNPNQPYMMADQLMASIKAPGSGWRRVEIKEAGLLCANRRRFSGFHNFLTRTLSEKRKTLRPRPNGEQSMLGLHIAKLRAESMRAAEMVRSFGGYVHQL